MLALRPDRPRPLGGGLWPLPGRQAPPSDTAANSPPWRRPPRPRPVKDEAGGGHPRISTAIQPMCLPLLAVPQRQTLPIATPTTPKHLSHDRAGPDGEHGIPPLLPLHLNSANTPWSMCALAQNGANYVIDLPGILLMRHMPCVTVCASFRCLRRQHSDCGGVTASRDGGRGEARLPPVQGGLVGGGRPATGAAASAGEPRRAGGAGGTASAGARADSSRGGPA